MQTPVKWLATAFVLPSLLSLSGVAQAEETRGFVFHPEAKVAQERPTLAQPMKLGFLGKKERLITPVFTHEGLFAAAPEKLWGLGKFPGDLSHPPVYDPSSETWFAWSNGMIVEVRPDGALPVIVEDPLGHDFDIRAVNGLIVFRDPNRNEIVLQSLNRNASGDYERTVLHRGIQFFNPRFSPDGDKIVVIEDGPRDGRLIVTDLKTRRTMDVGVGYQPAWAPDGKTLYFMDFENDGYNFTASSLHSRDLERGVTKKLFESKTVIATQPSVSRDGRSIAFFDEVSRDVAVATLPEQEVR